MKKILLLSLSLFLLSIVNAQYATPGTGVNWNMDSLVLYSNGVVTGIDDLYEIDNELTISISDTLILNNAEIITIGQDVNIYFYGHLEANNPTGLLLTPFLDETFGGLRFEEESSANLKHVTIQYGGGIKVITPHFIMDSCTVQDMTTSFTTGGAIELSNGNPLITNSSFMFNESAAISSAANAEVAPTISNNTFQANNYSNSNRPQINLGPSGSAGITHINGNTVSGGFNNDQVGGIAFSSLLGVDASVVIENNHVEDNRYGIAIIGSNISANIIGNTCINNNTQGDPMLGGSGLNFNSTSATSSAIVSENTISGNLWGITVQGEFEVNMGDESLLSPGLNIFIDNGNNDEIYALYNNTPNPISALNNCWDGLQSITLEEAEDVIFHQEDDASLGLVSFDPMWNCGAGIGIDELVEFELSVYPNPANDVLFIESNSQLEDFKIYTISGQLMKAENISTESPTRLTISDLEPGLYVIELTDGETVSRAKFIKK